MSGTTIEDMVKRILTHYRGELRISMNFEVSERPRILIYRVDYNDDEDCAVGVSLESVLKEITSRIDEEDVDESGSYEARRNELIELDRQAGRFNIEDEIEDQETTT